ncbi:methyl-accepting chemotaxis sensory transducer [gamma proteobacterium IMCC1989]|nr:methyl-accepting chemotaxis sensory transducer [gamma proteobacterium IMCC1989]
MPILATILAVIIAQVSVSLAVTQRSVDTLVHQVLSSLNGANQKTVASLDASQLKINDAIARLSKETTSSLSKTLSQQLKVEKSNVESLLMAAVQDTAKSMAELMALAAPTAIWDNDTPKLTQLVKDLHRNKQVLFARYYGIDGKPLTRFVNKKIKKVKELSKTGKGRKIFDKILDAAKKDPAVYLVEVDINPRGAVIGRFLLAMSNQNALDASAELDQRFISLVNKSKDKVKTAIAEESQTTKDAVAEAIDASHAIALQTSEVLQVDIDQSAEELLGSLSIVLVGLGILIIILLTAVFSIRVINKINMLTNSLKELSDEEGDLTQRIHIASKDEVGAMAEAVNLFISKTQDLVLRANASADDVIKHLPGLNDVSSNVAGVADRQEEKVTQVASSMDGMVRTIQEVSERIHDNLQNVNDIRSASIDAGRSSEQVRQVITDMVGDVQTATDTVRSVSDLSHQIESVLDMIRAIAEQTNLLALNASIEAARAGDAGRGFAVVADEVRNLASKTQQSIVDIQQQISALQNAVKQVVTSISQASGRAEQGIESINQSDKQIQNMSNAVQNLYDLTNDIVAMAEEQSQVSGGINNSLSDITLETQATGQAAVQNRESVQVLSKVAQELKLTLSRFKIS